MAPYPWRKLFLLVWTLWVLSLAVNGRFPGQRRRRFAGISRPARGSAARAASSRLTTPSRFGSPSSANMTGVANSSLMVVLSASTGTPSLRSSSLGPAGVYRDFQVLEPLPLWVSDSDGHLYRSHFVSGEMRLACWVYSETAGTVFQAIGDLQCPGHPPLEGRNQGL